MGIPHRVMAERAQATVVDHGRSMFGVPEASFVNHQFSNMYFSRLRELRTSVEEAACALWGKAIVGRAVKTLDVEPGDEVVVIGTLYKDMKRKPNVMDEVTRDVLEQLQGMDEAVQAKYCGEDDTMLLEDESGRIALAGEVLRGQPLVTGAIVAVRGSLSETGELVVTGLCLPGLPPQRALAAPAAADGGRYVALVSGLHVGHGSQRYQRITT